MKFVGRDLIFKQLESVTKDEENARLICVYGRRRVGKTTLIEKAFQDTGLFIEFEGQEGGSKKTQIATQFRILKKSLNIKKSTEEKKVSTWEDFFEILIDNLPKTPTVLFFDEFQWMANMRSDLISIFKIYWDKYLKKRKNLIVVICGSVSSFIVKKVIRSKALYGRIHLELDVPPLELTEIFEYFKGSLIEKDFLKYAMCFGGVPEYLSRVEVNKSFSQNLVELAFTKNAYFVNEYNRIFISHFGKHEIYEKVIEVIGLEGASTEEIANSLDIETGGRLTEVLRDLVLAGLIDRKASIDSKPNSKVLIFKIKDEYLLLYKSLISKYLSEIESGHFNGFDLINNKVLSQWYGYSFEQLCLRNTKLIAKALGFSSVNYKSGSWFKRNITKAAQVDLMFMRADKVITVCEIKHQSSLQAKKIISEFDKKIEVLKDYFPTYSIHKVLVTNESVKDKTLEQYFHHIVNMYDIASGKL